MRNVETTTRPELLTVKDLAAWLSMGQRTIWSHADSGKIPAPCRIGGSVRWRRAVIEEWLEQGCPPVRRKASR